MQAPMRGDVADEVVRPARAVFLGEVLRGRRPQRLQRGAMRGPVFGDDGPRRRPARSRMDARVHGVHVAAVRSFFRPHRAAVVR